MIVAAAQDFIQAATVYNSQLNVSKNNENCSFSTASTNSLSASLSSIKCSPSTSSDILPVSLTSSSLRPSSVAVETPALVNLSTQQCSLNLNGFFILNLNLRKKYAFSRNFCTN